MKKIYLLFVFSVTVVFAQTKSEQKEIVSQYNHSNIELLKRELLEFEIQKEGRISDFLLKNNQIKKDFNVGDKKFSINDIIDNKPVYKATDNVSSALATRTSYLYPGASLGLSLEGVNMRIGVWDGGWVLTNHVEFVNSNGVSRVSTPDDLFGNPTSDSHGTHVGGTMVASGVNASAKGMAPKASLASFNWGSDTSEVVAEASSNGLLLSNHSYGVPVLTTSGAQNAPTWMMGCYNTDCVQWDQIAFNAPFYLQVTSAGNSGSDSYTGGMRSGYDKLTGEKNAKNNLVIANANPSINPITGVINSLNINSSSSQGPSDDGRIKPDISGDGTNVLSSINTSTTAYDVYSGTSMASPNVSGSILLLQEYYNQLKSSFMRSATLKALVCHTALEAGELGPDPIFGYGLLDVRKAALLMQKEVNTNKTAIIDQMSLSQGATYSIDVFVTNPQKLEATLCWTDPAGTSKNNQLNSPTPALVNDLDIKIIKNTETFYPWKLQLSNVSLPAIKGDNIVDNLEKVEVDNAEAGSYTIQVTHKGSLVGGSQAYSLIVSGFDQLALNSKSFDSSKISIYPNPTNNVLFVNSFNNAISNYSIIDVQGRVVASKKIDQLNELEINMSDLNSGMYLIVLDSEYGSSTHKIVKK